MIKIRKKSGKSLFFGSTSWFTFCCSVRRLVEVSIGSGRAEIVLSNLLTPRHPVSIYYHTNVECDHKIPSLHFHCLMWWAPLLTASLPECGIWYWSLDTAAGDTTAWEAWGHGDQAHTLSWFIRTLSILGKFCYIRVVEFLHVKSAVKCFVVGHLNLNSRLWPVKNWQYIE